ncbi:GNAT family N-acetyltransferase [Nonomuraea sp. NPDC050310]|uniref:GNAT family N-acetyltransferase n=1 Tax=Nonomuraea sp. NPDC050310 TaxID=3154935 RepID=UPI0033E43F12
MLTVLEIPQWQGSGSPTATRLVAGAARLAALIAPGARHLHVPVDGSLAETAARVRQALPEDGFVVTIGGDCGVELEPIAAALRRYGSRLAVVWFDAHGDLNTPASSPSGAFHGMVLRTLLGDGPADLVPTPALRPEQVALVGARALDAGELDYIRDTGIGGLETLPEDAVVYVHIDLDVLAGIRSVGYPEPGGLTPAALAETVARIAEQYEIVGLGITEYAPSDPATEIDWIDGDDSVDQSSTGTGNQGNGGDLPASGSDGGGISASGGDRDGGGLSGAGGDGGGISDPGTVSEGWDDGGDFALLSRLVPELVRLCRASGPWQIERRAANAWPAGQVTTADGWLLRHTPDVPRRRSNSALPQLGSDPALSEVLGDAAPFHPERALAALDRFYAGRSLPVIVQVTPSEHRRGLDDLLAAAGYAVGAQVLILTADARPIAALDTGAAAPVDDRTRWAELFEAVTGDSSAMAVIDRIVPKSTLVAKDRAGLGLAVSEDGWTGLFCMATHPGSRRQGVATAVLAAAARWSVEQGADRLYLQVEEENQAARAVYEGLGFTLAYRYHYRVRP